jgi:hypothetical protein
MGEGYFVLKASDTLPEHESLGEVLADQYAYELQSGWNIITNPYGGNVKLEDVLVQRNDETPVNWADAVTNGWLDNAIYYYEGPDWGGVYDFETTPEAVLVPWMGYWVHVNDGGNTYKLMMPKP